MSHAIDGGFLEATTKEEAMDEGYGIALDFAETYSDSEENPFGDYHGNFKFYDKTFNSEDEAMDFFYGLGSYCDGVCKVRDGNEIKYFAKYEVHC